MAKGRYLLLAAEQAPLLLAQALLHALQRALVLLHLLLLRAVQQVQLVLEVVQVPEALEVPATTARRMLAQQKMYVAL